jgi:uroporphyrinogen III methyltransferase/synthase
MSGLAGAGVVTLIGAGPGAPDLITVRGLDRLRRAQVVLYDELSARALLDEVPADAEVLYVGKRGEKKALGQEELSALLVERARRGLRVVRLKGGDPFVLGRGGEEALALAAAGVPFEVVPGVTSAVAVPAFAGIPLTHRGIAEGFEVHTGHKGHAAAGRRTVVVLMGMRHLAENVAGLVQGGLPESLPAAVVQHGTVARQRSVVATLGTIVEAARHLESPAVLVAGEVVALREQLAWFESRPLFGRTVLVTRARHQAAETCRLLEQLGAETVAMPTIDLRPPADPEPLRRAVREVGSYDFLILTSANAVRPLREALAEQGLDGRALAGVTLCAIGPGTADALAAMGLRADLVPADHRAEGILELLTAERVAGRRVLLPRAAVARDILPRTLEERGAAVEVVTVYETGMPDPERTRAGLRALEAGEVDVLTFTSASTAENFADIVGRERLDRLCRGLVVVAIGPVTRDACRRVGLEVHVMPESYTLAAMTEALVRYLEAQQT